MSCSHTHTARAAPHARSWGARALGDALDGLVSPRLCAALLTPCAAAASYRAPQRTVAGRRSWNSGGAEPLSSPDGLEVLLFRRVRCADRLGRQVESGPNPAG